MSEISKIKLVDSAGSPEAIAWKLFESIALAEDKNIAEGQNYRGPADREWILNTYAQCLVTVVTPFDRANKSK